MCVYGCCWTGHSKTKIIVFSILKGLFKVSSKEIVEVLEGMAWVTK